MKDQDEQIDRRNWLEAELADMLDEDYELELSEPALSLELPKIYRHRHPASLDRESGDSSINRHSSAKTG